jgi:hypothetical protein
MDKTSLSATIYFEAAVKRQLVLARGVADEYFGEVRKMTVEVVVASEKLDQYDVVVDFRDLEMALDEQLKPMHDSLSNDVGVGDILKVASKLANKLSFIVPKSSKVKEINFIDNNGRRVSLHP